jgi:hypothetical protein
MYRLRRLLHALPGAGHPYRLTDYLASDFSGFWMLVR